MKALGFCLGTGYTDEVDTAWKKIFSATIQIVVPAAILEEEALAKEQQHAKDEDLPETLRAIVTPVATKPTTPVETVRVVATSASAPVLPTVSTPVATAEVAAGAVTDALVTTDATAAVPAPEGAAATTTEAVVVVAVVAPVAEATPAAVV